MINISPETVVSLSHTHPSKTGKAALASGQVINLSLDKLRLLHEAICEARIYWWSDDVYTYYDFGAQIDVVVGDYRGDVLWHVLFLDAAEAEISAVPCKSPVEFNQTIRAWHNEEDHEAIPETAVFINYARRFVARRSWVRGVNYGTGSISRNFPGRTPHGAYQWG